MLKAFSKCEEEMVVIGEIVNPSDIKTRRLLPADLSRCLVEQFHSELKFIDDLALQHLAREPVVLIAGAGVDPVAAAAKGHPVAKILLNPDRYKGVSPASAGPAGRIARGRLQQRVDGD